ncbi:MAG: hypothetical protein JO081_13340, partial [Alphaproteobacteria bacterium]|nr:hypothetical protein [Alphaproteobacteria bacterium]
MSPRERKVSTTGELLAAVADQSIREIAVTVNLTGLSTFRLSPGQALIGASPKIALRFAAGQDGVQLSTDNRVEGVELITDLERQALFNDTGVNQLGRLVLRNLRTTGVVRLLAR